MRRRNIQALLAAALCLALASACATTSQGQPQQAGTSRSTGPDTSSTTAPTSTPQSGGQLPSDGAPKVENPLDASQYQQHPCQMLTVAQLQELNLPAQGEQRVAPLGLACHWFNQDSGGNVDLQWADRNPRGLSGDYAAHKAGRFAYFIEYPNIEGFPGVASDLSDGRDKGACIVTVGVTDQLEFQAGLGLSLPNIGKKDPCEVAVQVAAMVLKTMKGGA